MDQPNQSLGESQHYKLVSDKKAMVHDFILSSLNVDKTTKQSIARDIIAFKTLKLFIIYMFIDGELHGSGQALKS